MPTDVASPAAGLALEARDLSFGYVRGANVLDRWSATFEPGTMTALTGPSGRGKSTLLYLLGLMLKPSSGHVLLSGRPMDELSDAERARTRALRFGFVFQDAALDPTRTVLDNVTEAILYQGGDRRAAQTKALDLLSRFGVNVHPGRRPGQVSGGQAQRIALCRALLTDPSVLLADEPTGNLDPDTSELVVQALGDHAKLGGTVIVVTHTPGVADACDRRILL